MFANLLKEEPMDQYRYCSIIIVILLGLFFGCDEGRLWLNDYPDYSGAIDCEKHSWLAKRKIFLDPGHGVKAQPDRFRQGPHGVTEEAVNLRVALILRDMLTRAGVHVTVSRSSHKDVDLDTRIAMVKKASPDFLVSIHHNGSPRRCDAVNYPSVLIWGNRHLRPASYDFARILQGELERIMDGKGQVVSDFSVFRETGTRILRRTREVCPGVIGEGGFFSDERHARRLADLQYNIREAEAYFKALSRYFRHGVPTGVVEIEGSLDNSSYLQNMVTVKNPDIFIRLKSDCPDPKPAGRSLKVTLDDVPVSTRCCSPGLYRVLYGKKLYPGGHQIRFHFRNGCGNNSMVMYTGFTVKIEKGDYSRLIRRGRYLVNYRRNVRQGVLMLSAAHSMEQTGPGAERLYYDLYRGFRRLGLHCKARYYLDSLVHFYPQSYSARRYRHLASGGKDRFPVKFHGKKVPLISGVSCR